MKADAIEADGTVHIRQTLTELWKPHRFEVKLATKNGEFRDVKLPLRWPQKLNWRLTTMAGFSSR